MKLRNLFLYPTAVLIFAISGAAIQATDICDTKALKERAKAALDPYKYDSGKVTRLMYKKKESVKEVEVPVFVGEAYRFVFNSENITRAVVVSIYNKDKEAKNRKQLHTFTVNSSQPIHTWDPDGKKTHYYVDYTLPASSDSVMVQECMVMMLGYK
jgi:hypothetical protein